ncbi:SigmaW regulon antibacterial [Anatilimnocola aggregata]|uniref:SigmaW regulon antibacterial n=1 Tax=Anatilimnocola aggregata TaxID=2528021 RepID=A0A517YBJ7_9BACT|nr:flotillin-like FloA family protein [Anatilimnocola aggregata]QDU27620.1 SigmaW regulon antibacterial [Anatilimnocola aggregata]
MGPKEIAIFLAGLMVGILLTICFAFVLRIFSPWLRCFLGGAPVSFFSLIGMLLRGTPVNLLVDAHLSLVHSGKGAAIRELESTYIAQRGKILTSNDLVNVVAANRVDQSRHGE